MASSEPHQRKIVLLDTSGSPFPGLEINITAIPNANPQAIMYIEVKEQCDLGHWHRLDFLPLSLSPWGSD